MTFDPSRVGRRMRHAYEIGRIRRAAVLALPWVGLLMVGLWLGPFGLFDFGLGTLLVVTGFAYLWRGQLAEQALVPGLISGLFPLGLALLANGPNPQCHHGQGGLSLCTFACGVGGVLAAMRISKFARRQESSPMAFGLAVIPAFFLGSLGCGCIGYTGVMAMAGAMFLTSLPELMRWAQKSV